MKSTSQLLATILISLALVSAAPVPSPAGPSDILAGLTPVLTPLQQQYCKDGKNFKDPVCAEWNAVQGSGASPQRRQDFSNAVPNTSGFPNPISPVTGTLGSAGSLLTGTAPSKDSQAFPNPVSEVTSVLSGTSGPAGKPAVRRQLGGTTVPPATTQPETTETVGQVTSLLGDNGAVGAALKREPASPSLNDLSNLGALGPALGGHSAVPQNGAFNFGNLPGRQLTGALLGGLSDGSGSLTPSTPPPPQKRQTIPGFGGSFGFPSTTGAETQGTPAAPGLSDVAGTLGKIPVVGPLVSSLGSPASA